MNIYPYTKKNPALSALSFSALYFWDKLRALSEGQWYLTNPKANTQNQKEYICTPYRRHMYLNYQ
jgi:hypothetical protein